ncbi:MAG: hypothetical protein K2G39_03645, partial [Lachnospiraceae bacterium]|nr:hypothetical protein [Lachnospiraceae bacterium]
MKKLSALLLAAVMTMGLLTACGDSKTTAEAGNETTQTEAESTQTQPDDAADAAQTEEEANAEEAADAETAALADGVLTVGTNAEFPPFEFVAGTGVIDQYDGIDMA